jgi:pimeloyl-ACP methyl ester carboxylesterase
MENTYVTSTNIAGFPAMATEGSPQKPPLLFIHGSFVGHESFAPWLRFFGGAGWRCMAASRRGRAGIGPERAKGLSIGDYVDDTLKVIDALGETPIVIGHSLGGLIAQKIAELGKARAAVLVCPAPAAMLTAQAAALPTYLPMMPKILAGMPSIPAPKGCSTIALNEVPAAQRPAIHKTLVHESGKVYREMIVGTFKIDFSKITCPVMVMGGRNDRIVSAKLVEWTAGRLGVPARIYERHAHWLMDEPGWEEIAAEALAFVNVVSGTGEAKLRRVA